MGVIIKIEAEVHPTENVNLIKRSILNLFPDAKFELVGERLMAESRDIENFATLLKEQRIRDTARSVFLSRLRDGEIEFWLSKQVATVGRVSFSVGDVPLGDIRVVIQGDSLPQLIDEIAPDTSQRRSRS